MDVKKFLEEIKALTVVELNDLVKAIETEFGVSAAATTVAAGPAAVAEVEEKTEFNVVLTVTGDRKIEVIKAVREITGLGLVEAKNMAEKVPATIKEGVSKEVGQQLVDKLKAAGGTAELK